MKARIYKPSKSVMQSGRAKDKNWLLEYELESARVPEDLIGWVSSSDTLNQVRIPFKNKSAAIAFAEGKNWLYTVQESKKRQIKPRNYIDNFKYEPPEEV